mgnify:CR=1 FL=1
MIINREIVLKNITSQINANRRNIDTNVGHI